MPRVVALVLLLLGAACVDSSRRAPTGTGARPAPAPATATPRPAPAPARPAWVARKVVPNAVTTPQGRFHIVRSGETGIAIARAYGVPWSQLVQLNNLAPPYNLEIGDRLRLPAAKTVAAMTPEQRARAFDITLDDLVTGGEPAERPVAVAVPRKAPSSTATGRSLAPPPTLTGPAPAFRWPVEGRIISGFGAKPGGRFNDGVNLKASAGQPVRAAADGVVAYAGDAIPGFGNLVLIKHAGGWVTAYGHNEAVLVSRGDKVGGGEVIARAGQTGAVSEPQVHFEVRQGRKALDPARLIGGR